MGNPGLLEKLANSLHGIDAPPINGCDPFSHSKGHGNKRLHALFSKVSTSVPLFYPIKPYDKCKDNTLQFTNQDVTPFLLHKGVSVNVADQLKEVTVLIDKNRSIAPPK
jgi:hypothetical protein